MYKTFANFDFTLDKYERLCQAVAASKYTPVTLSGYLSPGQDRSGSYLVMRHDIDRSPTRALGTAALESTYRIPASYYFRDRRATFVPEIMDRAALWDMR